ncbi:transcriptional regulator family: Fungal Specific TF [Penicillium verhagenii]|nr:transcriptional regulator family: Fungal Specific TF [Penicillium verhagenii]
MERRANSPRGGRLRSACDLCRHKKIRCDNVKPACETCFLAKVSCTFSLPAGQERKTIQRQLADTRARVQALEETLKGKGSPGFYDDSPARTPPGRSILPKPARNHISNPSPTYPHILDTWEFCSAVKTFESHLTECGLGIPGSFERTSLCDAFKSQHALHAKKADIMTWPPRKLVRQCLEYYSANGIYSIFPIVDVQVMHKLLNDNVLEQPETEIHAANRAILAIFTAFMSRIRRHEPEFLDTDPDAYAQAALGLLPELLMEDGDIRSLETFLLLAIYIAPGGQAAQAGLFLSMATRIVFNLGGNRKFNPHKVHNGNQSADQHLRDVFWLCYCMDKEMSSRRCQPPMIKDEDCDLELPTNYVQQSSDSQIFSKPLSSDELLFPTDLRLGFIKSKIYRLLYSEHAQSQSETQRLQYIRELDLELGHFKSSFPPGCQPELFATETTPNYICHDLSLRGVNVHLQYYFCLGRIHGANIESSKQSLGVGNRSTLPSSLELYYQAARSTLVYFVRVRHFVNPVDFWLHAQFLFTAVLSLFQYLIMNPTAATFSGDLRILEGTMEIYASHNRTPQRKGCFPPFYMTEALIRQLIILAKQSLSKAMDR